MANTSFHPEAQAEYEAAIAWYLAREPKAATRFEIEVDRVLGLIENSPEMFPNYDDEHRFAVLQRFPYSIVYITQNEHVHVVAVAHSRRSPGYWQSRG